MEIEPDITIEELDAVQNRWTALHAAWELVNLTAMLKYGAVMVTAILVIGLALQAGPDFLTAGLSTAADIATLVGVVGILLLVWQMLGGDEVEREMRKMRLRAPVVFDTARNTLAKVEHNAAATADD